MSDESILGPFIEDYSLFIEAGFIAVKQADEIAARRLFKAAEVLNPANAAAQLGLGYIALNKLQITEACAIFEALLKKDPDYHIASAFLGVAYLLTKDKRKQGEQLIMTAREKSDDPTIQNLAKVCMAWVNQDLMKSNLPPLKAALAKANGS